jgi:dTDP-glucose 4,6-dehydratase
MTSSSKKRFLVTGGAGFIGGNFVAQAMAGDWGEVLVLDKLTYAGHLATLSPWEGREGYRFVEGDIGDRTLVRSLLTDFRPHFIVNFAAESHVDRSIESAEEFIQTNVVGTHALLDEALRYWEKVSPEEQSAFKFHHVSTDEVYGSLPATGAFQETTPYAPNSPYAASKAASDHLVRATHQTYGLPTTITNCSNNYGPYQFPEKLIPLALLNALEGKEIPVYGDGGNIRDWLFVADHCTAILSVLAHGTPGETYNVGGKAERTNLDLLSELFGALVAAADLIAEVTGRAPRKDYASLITFVKDRPGHDRRYAIDSSKITRELGWQPAESLTTGLERTVRWYVKNRAWCEKVSSANYDRGRLGLARAEDA